MGTCLKIAFQVTLKISATTIGLGLSGGSLGVGLRRAEKAGPCHPSYCLEVLDGLGQTRGRCSTIRWNGLIGMERFSLSPNLATGSLPPLYIKTGYLFRHLLSPGRMATTFLWVSLGGMTWITITLSCASVRTEGAGASLCGRRFSLSPQSAYLPLALFILHLALDSINSK